MQNRQYFILLTDASKFKERGLGWEPGSIPSRVGRATPGVCLPYPHLRENRFYLAFLPPITEVILPPAKLLGKPVFNASI